MEILQIKDFNFKYPQWEKFSLKNINITIEEGQFVTICGVSGSGKTTLLRQLKPVLAAHGTKNGSILYRGKDINLLDRREESSQIGFVQQKPQNQVVTDKVWHELAFGLECLGYSNREIRLKVGEIAGFFGIEDWFYRNVSELSGGQLQILNLASIMAMQPQVLILDEPTSQLDPIMASKFTRTLKKINLDFGTTVIITEHRLDETIPISDKIIILEGGKEIFDDKKERLGQFFVETENQMIKSMPVPLQIYANTKSNLDTPLTINEGRKFINKMVGEKALDFKAQETKLEVENRLIEFKEVFFRYEKDLPDVLRGLDLEINKGEIYSILGGNGAGKSTILKLISRLEKPTRGKIYMGKKDLRSINSEELYRENLCFLPQNPQDLFVKKTVELDLLEALSRVNISKAEKMQRVKDIVEKLDIGHLLESHPFDISGGEQQRMALAKILLLNPKIILMDEPTKGMDGFFKSKFEKIIYELKKEGVTIVIVSHDVEFCALVSDNCALLFKGEIISCGRRREFFNGNYFYSTAANKMCRGKISNVITIEDAVNALNMEKDIKDGKVCN